MTAMQRVKNLGFMQTHSHMDQTSKDLYETTILEHVDSREDHLRASLRDIWATVLQEDLSAFSDDDAFFEVGGDSKLAQTLMSEARERGIIVSVQQIFSHPSINDMTKVARLKDASDLTTRQRLHLNSNVEPVDSARDEIWKRMITSTYGLPVERIERLLPCTAMQEALITEVDGQSNSYVRQFVFHVDDDVAIERFRDAWIKTIEANTSLRTQVYRLEDPSRLLQVVTTDQATWQTNHMPLDLFLDQDASSSMTLGTQLSRYAIIHDSTREARVSRHFVWTIHHAVCDGVSISKILEEVSNRFRGRSPCVGAPFSSFIESTAMRPGIENERGYWRTSLAEINPTPFPPLAQDHLHTQPVPDSILVRTMSLSRVPRFGVTRALLLRAAWTILLSHHTGTEDVCFGAINDGRSTDVVGIDSMTGPTINLTPIALRVQPEQTVAAFMNRVRDQSAEMLPYQHSGLSRIRNFLGNDISTALDFQTLFVVHPAEFSEVIEPATDAMGLRYMSGSGKKEQHSYPLIVTFTLGQEGQIKLEIQHDSRVLCSKQAENLSHQLQAVLDALGEAAEDATIGSISPVSKHDLDLIRQWNGRTPQPEDVTIQGLFGRQARKRPNATAVCSTSESLTYSEVDDYSSRLAAQITGLGVTKGQYVGICFEKSIWTVVAILAVFKSGGIYVPLDVTHPRARIMETLEQVGLRIILASPSGATLFEGQETMVVTVDSPPPLQRQSAPPNEALPVDLAYLLFTSGTTGKPKGILMTHTAICTSIVHHGTAYGAGPHWRTLQFGAHTFDLSIAEFFTTLAFGGCICVPSDYDRLNHLSETITALDVTTLMVVPTVANLLLPEDVPTLRTIVLAGEPITKETITRWADYVELTAGYGPSETAVYCSGNVKVSADAHPAHIGGNIGGTMWITASEDPSRLTAVGCVGEIVISGAIVGAGYFGDRATTNAVFLPAPEWMRQIDPNNKYSTVYRSGDLARYNPDGTLHIVGRRDTQVKLRGFRIELGEIENQIMSHGTATAALADLPKSGSFARRIVAVVSFDTLNLDDHRDFRIALSPTINSPKNKAYLTKLKQHLTLSLPEYMSPSIWMIVEKMPLLVSGKVDRKRIRQWIATLDNETYKAATEESSLDAPSNVVPNSMADTIRRLWADVLHVEPLTIGLGTSFFAQGGDSIAAIVISNLAKKTGLSVPVRTILRTKNLQQLATLVESTQETGLHLHTEQRQYDVPNAASLLEPWAVVLQSQLSNQPAATIEDAYPLSPFQIEIMRQRLINPSIFIISWRMEIISTNSQPVSLHKLSRAWKNVVTTYPVLRTIFLRDVDAILPPVQVVLAKVEPQIDISTANSDDPEPTFDAIGSPSIDDSFLPHRAHFIQHGDSFYVHIELDHRTIDGWSLKLIKSALLQAYEHEYSYPIQPPPSFKSFVIGHHLDRTETDDQYWASALSEQPSSRLMFPITECDSHSLLDSRKTIVYLPEIDAQALGKFSVENGVTPASIFSAAWAQTLGHFIQSSDVSFEYIVAGRDETVDGVFDIVGPLINALVCHLRNISGSDLASLALRIQEQQTMDSDHSSSNVRDVVARQLGVELPFNTAVNFQRRPTAVETASLKIDDDLRGSVDPWHFDVLARVLHITDDNTFKTSLEFYANMFDARRMEEVANDWWARVQKIIS